MTGSKYTTAQALAIQSRVSKTCPSCGKQKMVYQFSKSSAETSGYRCRCKECDRKSRKEQVARNKSNYVEPSPDISKTCSKCGESKSLPEFAFDPGYSDCISAMCCECAKKVACDSSKKNRPRINAWRREWRAKKSVRDRELHLRRQSRKKPHRRKSAYEYGIKSRYGLSLDDYEEMLLKQGGVCQICGKHPKSGKRLNVDHDHKTEKIRGLLCGNCNRALGLFSDDTDCLMNAAKYIEKHNL